MKENNNSPLSRRNVIKKIGAATALSVVGSGVGSAQSTKEDSISAEMVVADDPESVEEFVLKTLEQGETNDVVEAYENLNDEQLSLVRDAYERVTATEIISDGDFSTLAIPISETATYRHYVKETNSTIWTGSLTLDYEYSGDSVFGGNISTSGSAPNSLWHYEGVDDSDLTSSSSEYHASATLRFKHSVLGEHVSTNLAVLDITGGAGYTNESADRVVL